jgi:hypothetical protein
MKLLNTQNNVQLKDWVEVLLIEYQNFPEAILH